MTIAIQLFLQILLKTLSLTEDSLRLIFRNSLYKGNECYQTLMTTILSQAGAIAECDNCMQPLNCSVRQKSLRICFKMADTDEFTFVLCGSFMISYCRFIRLLRQIVRITTGLCCKITSLRAVSFDVLLFSFHKSLPCENGQSTDSIVSFLISAHVPFFSSDLYITASGCSSSINVSCSVIFHPIDCRYKLYQRIEGYFLASSD